VFRESKDKQEFRVRPGLLAKPECKVQRVLLELLDVMDRQASKVLQAFKEILESRAKPEFRVRRALREQPGFKAFKETLALKGPLVLLVRLAFKGPRASRESQGSRDRRALLGPPEFKATLG
jgi:hypothetical protein